MRENFERAFQHVVGHEGGFTADPRDRGNWTTGKIGSGVLKGTKFGVSAMAYPDLDIKNLTVADAHVIYRRDYWNACRCDELPSGVDYIVFDAAVNHGNDRSIRFLQQAVGAVVDGRIGPETIKRVRSRDADAIIREFCSIRMLFYTDIKSWKTYRRGWTRRLIDTVAFALDLSKEPKKAPEPVPANSPSAPSSSILSRLFRRVS